jgi:hypothetical protein
MSKRNKIAEGLAGPAAPVLVFMVQGLLASLGIVIPFLT